MCKRCFRTTIRNDSLPTATQHEPGKEDCGIDTNAP